MREALILLEYQGLVRRLPNNHVRVAELSGDCLDHIFELGLALEAEVLEKWADPEELPDEELEFHRYLYEKCPFDFSEKCWKLLWKFIFVLESVQEIISWKKIRRAA